MHAKGLSMLLSDFVRDRYIFAHSHQKSVARAEPSVGDILLR